MLKIDWQSGVPAYDQIVQGLIKLKALGALSSGDKLPSVRAMAGKLGVNPNTVQKAYLILEEKGIIYSALGKGSFLSDSDEGTKAVLDSAKESLSKAVYEALNLGLSQLEAQKIIDNIYSKGGKKND